MSLLRLSGPAINSDYRWECETGLALAQAFAAAGPSLFATTELVRVFTDLHCLELA